MGLADLPVELIAPVMAFLNGHHIGKLVLCGNSRLNARLTQGGVRGVDIELSTTAKPVWPALLASLPSLRCLRIGFAEAANCLYVQAFQWSLVPKTLTELKVRVREPLDFYLPALETLRIEWPYELNYGLSFTNFSLLTPNLKTLQFGKNSTSECWARLKVSWLPASLTSLSGRFLALEPDGDDYYDWPRPLVSLDIWVSVLQDGWKFTKSIPSCIEHFRVPSHQIPHDTIDWSFARLKALETVVLSPDTIHIAELLLLPRTLKTFGVTTRCAPGLLSVDILAALPQSLTRLETQEFQVSPEVAAALPRNLVEIANSEKPITLSSTDALQHMPPGFRSPILVGSLGPESLAYPLSITDLSSQSSDPAQFQFVPPALRSLTLRFVVTPAEIHALPRGLTELNLTHTSIEKGVDYQTMDLSGLPLRILSITVRKLSGGNRIAGLGSLPSTLTSLELENVRLADAPSFFKTLPEKLKSLQIRQVQSLDVSTLPSLKAFPLETFIISFVDSTNVGRLANILPLLPSGLMVLGLTFASPRVESGFTDADIALLPRGLITLNISACKKLTKRCVENLPPFLEAPWRF